MDFWLFCMCFINILFKIITNPKFYNCCFIKEDLQKHFCIIGRCFVRQRNPWARPNVCQIYRLESNPRLWLDSWQSLEIFAKIIFVTSISVLFKSWMNPWSLPPWYLGTEWNFFLNPRQQVWGLKTRDQLAVVPGGRAHRPLGQQVKVCTTAGEYSPTGNGLEWRAVPVSSGQARVWVKQA